VISAVVKEACRNKACCHSYLLWVGFVLFVCACFPARANVYASDIRLNGSLQGGVVLPGHPLTISFILNDVATNVSVQIYAGTNMVKTFDAGTNAGLNTVVWDGTNDDSSVASVGAYNVRITANAAGYNEWTNITDDGIDFDVFYPTGIAVNRNTNSPYYGRVFIGNAPATDVTNPGIFKCNADGSPVEEGSFSTGGYPWSGGGYANPSPWKMDVGPDDRLYVEDLSGNGTVMSFDQVLSTNYFDVLRLDNYAYTNIVLDGPYVCGNATNIQLFMADISSSGWGILSWALNSNSVAATNDIGTVEITTTNNSDPDFVPYAAALAPNGDIFVIERVQDTSFSSAEDDATNRVFRFPSYAGTPDATALWEIGANDLTLENSTGISIDPTGTFVAVANRGYGSDPENLVDGGVSVFSTKDGTLVTNISESPEGVTNECVDVAWDETGNLYITYDENSFSQSGWRAYSPPGPNQATTVAVPVIQVYRTLTPPQLDQATNCMGQLNFTLTGQSSVTYVVQQSPDLVNWAPVCTNFALTPIVPISISPPDTQDFYRAVTSP